MIARPIRLLALAAWTCAAPLCAQGTPAPTDSAQAYFDRAFALIRSHALHADAADWAALRSEASAQLGGARTPAETYAAIRFLLRRLGDGPAALSTSDQAAALRAA